MELRLEANRWVLLLSEVSRVCDLFGSTRVDGGPVWECNVANSYFSNSIAILVKYLLTKRFIHEIINQGIYEELK